MSPDDAAKLVMSAGLIQPEEQKKLELLAAKGRGKVKVLNELTGPQ
jgi:uncharacterized membrane protein